MVVTKESAGVNEVPCKKYFECSERREAPYKKQSLNLMISGARGRLRFNFTLRFLGFSKASGFGAHSVQT